MGSYLQDFSSCTVQIFPTSARLWQYIFPRVPDQPRNEEELPQRCFRDRRNSLSVWQEHFGQSIAEGEAIAIIGESCEETVSAYSFVAMYPSLRVGKLVGRIESVMPT